MIVYRRTEEYTNTPQKKKEIKKKVDSLHT
jgi:hypothetical protein